MRRVRVPRIRRMAAVWALVAGIFVPAAAVGAAPVSTYGVPPVGHASVSTAFQERGVLAAQADTSQIVDVSPSADGMPGADLIRKLLAWLSQLALWGSLGSILAGATVYGIAQNSSHPNGAFRGKQLAVAGAIGAALAGLAPTVITMLFRAAGG